MEDDWQISEPFVCANEEDAQFQFYKPAGPPHRPDFDNWEERGQPGVRGRLIEIVHGCANGSMEYPRTLIVFEWQLMHSAGQERIRNMKIVVSFQATGERYGVPKGSSIANWDPFPIEFVPRHPTWSQNSTYRAIETVGTEIGAGVGYSDYVNTWAKHNTSGTYEVERPAYASIRGYSRYHGKSSGKHNEVVWELEENASLKSGVQHEVYTAVLLGRKCHDLGKFKVDVRFEANCRRNNSFMGLIINTLKLNQGGGQSEFDPTIEPGTSNGDEGNDDVAARKTNRDWKNMCKSDLDEVLIKNQKLEQQKSCS